MGHMEHLLNVYAAKAAAGSVAEFMGYIEVSEEEASSRLTPGLWLVRGGFGFSSRALCAQPAPRFLDSMSHMRTLLLRPWPIEHRGNIAAYMHARG